jgi:hypothetical protein
MLKTVSTQLALASDTLPEVLAKGNTTGGTDLAVSSGDDITLADNSKVIFGAGSDLSIYSDGATGQVTGSVNVTGAGAFGSEIKVTGGALPGATAGLFTVSGLSTGKLTGSGASKASSITTYYDDTYIEIVAGVSPGYMSGISLGGRGYAGTGADAITLSPRGVPALTLAGATGAATFSDNIIIGTSGKGIDFSATAGTGTSELLDDYEEGTFSITSDSGQVVIAANTGYYTKVGRVVTCTGAVSVASIGTPVGNVGFDGLPFATANATNIGAGISLYTYGWKTSMTTHVMASLSGNSSSWFVQKSNGAGSVAVLSGDVQATTYIQYTIVYQTA